MDTSEPVSDPGLLFTPEGSGASASSPPFTSQPSTPSINTSCLPKTQAFFISIPGIPAAQKKLYKTADETCLKSDAKYQLDEIIGEYRDDDMLYYFARYKGGIARKVGNEYCLACITSLHPPFCPVPLKALSEEI